MASTTVVFYLSDEIFASHTPILLTLDAQSTAILKIERATDRLATVIFQNKCDWGDETSNTYPSRLDH